MNTLLKDYYTSLHIDERVFDYCQKIEDSLKNRFAAIDAICEINQMKVIKAMQDNRLAEAHFAGSSGYGYTDDGRDTLEQRRRRNPQGRKARALCRRLYAPQHSS